MCIRDSTLSFNKVRGVQKMKETKWTAQILLQSNRLTRVEFFSPSNLREDAEATVKALYNVTDVRQLRRLWN